MLLLAILYVALYVVSGHFCGAIGCQHEAPHGWPRLYTMGTSGFPDIHPRAEGDQLEYTAPTGFRFLDEPMFCFSTLNANTNPNPNCRPGHRPWPLTPWQSLPGRRPWPLRPCKACLGTDPGC